MRRFIPGMLLVGLMSVASLAQTEKKSAAPGEAGPAKAAASTGQAPVGTSAGEKTAEQQFKNIQVLDGVPASKVLPSMHFIEKSLGVGCEFCHVMEGFRFEADEKPEKTTARKMIRMVMEINRNNFNGNPAVSCNTCHRGSPSPVAVPALTANAGPAPKGEAGEAKAEKLPSAEEIVNRYLEAVGGRDALAKAKTRTMSGFLVKARMGRGPGGPGAPAEDRLPLKIQQESPDRYRAEVTMPNGVMVQGYDGSTAWMKAPNGMRPVNPEESDRLRRQAVFNLPLQVAQDAQKMRVRGKEKYGAGEAYVLSGRQDGGRRVALWFDTQSGLLVKRVTLTPLPIGMDPEEIEFSDYKPVGGIKMPFTVKGSYLDEMRQNYTQQFVDIQQNAAVDEKGFAAPTTAP